MFILRAAAVAGSPGGVEGGTRHSPTPRRGALLHGRRTAPSPLPPLATMAGGLRHRATHAAASKGSHALTNEWRDEYTITAVDGEQFADPAGRVVGKYLRSEGAGDGEALRTVAADVALELMDNEGYRLLDPRIQWSYDEWHIEDPRVEHIPYHREIKGNSPAQLYRKVGFAIFVENPPFEQVPDFLNQVRLKFNEDDKILVACDCGGRIIRCEDDEYEVNNRDIIATSHDIIFLLRKTGFKNVVHVAGGFCSWRKTPALVERTPGVTVNYPWEKTGPLREFFPKPCEWSYVYACDPNSALPIEECGCECGDMTGPNFDPSTRPQGIYFSDRRQGKGKGAE